LSCARAAALKGLRVVVIDRDLESNGASVRNFGFVAVTGQERGKATRRPEAVLILEAFLKTEMGEGCEILSRAAARARCGEVVNERVHAVLSSSIDLRVESREAIPKIAAWLAARLGVVFLRRTATRQIRITLRTNALINSFSRNIPRRRADRRRPFASAGWAPTPRPIAACSSMPPRATCAW
jgi:glycine/D-amino acid oxidase-like deaminating enzyme